MVRIVNSLTAVLQGKLALVREALIGARSRKDRRGAGRSGGNGVHAAKVGLFEMDWLLICAYCPQVTGSYRELDQLHPRFQCAFCNAINDVALDDYIQVTFTVSSGVRDIIFRHPEMLSVEEFYLRYDFSKGFIAPHGMTHQQLVAALSRGFADIEAHEHRASTSRSQLAVSRCWT